MTLFDSTCCSLTLDGHRLLLIDHRAWHFSVAFPGSENRFLRPSTIDRMPIAFCLRPDDVRQGGSGGGGGASIGTIVDTATGDKVGKGQVFFSTHQTRRFGHAHELGTRWWRVGGTSPLPPPLLAAAAVTGTRTIPPICCCSFVRSILFLAPVFVACYFRVILPGFYAGQVLFVRTLQAVVDF